MNTVADTFVSADTLSHINPSTRREDGGDVVYGCLPYAMQPHAAPPMIVPLFGGSFISLAKPFFMDSWP